MRVHHHHQCTHDDSGCLNFTYHCFAEAKLQLITIIKTSKTNFAGSLCT